MTVVMLSVCVLLCVFFVTAEGVDPVFDYDFFFPGAYFQIKGLSEGKCENCGVYLYLDDVERYDKANFESTDGPSTRFKLSGPVQDSYYILESVENLPDSQTPGIYPDSHIVVEKEGKKVGNSQQSFTFYKSQVYMDSDTADKGIRKLAIPEEGTYTVGWNKFNYVPHSNVHMHFDRNFKHSETEEPPLYFKATYDGVKTCDHFVVYDGSKEESVLAFPTIFNVTPVSNESEVTDSNGNKIKIESKYTNYSKGTQRKQFETQFISDDSFSYSAYAPQLNFDSELHSEDLENENASYISLNWTIGENDSTDSDSTQVKEGSEQPLHFSRTNNSEINVELEMNINQKFLDELYSFGMDELHLEKNKLPIVIAICNTGRKNDGWPYADPEACSKSKYEVPPPYGCTLTAKAEINQINGTIKFNHSNSTREIVKDDQWSSIVQNITDGSQQNIKRIKIEGLKFNASEANPIPFRFVPLVGLYEGKEGDDDQSPSNIRFVPLGPASKIYYIDLNTTPGLVFFVVVFLVISALSLAAYFIGKVIVKKVRAKEGVKSKLLAEQDDDSNVSMIDTSYNEQTGSEQPLRPSRSGQPSSSGSAGSVPEHVA